MPPPNTSPQFPQGIATEDAFCNREKERELLKKSIERHEHLVLTAPRRYGKTSLIMQVLHENTFPGTRIDFFFSTSQSDVLKAISEGVSALMNDLLPEGQATRSKIINQLITLNPKLTFQFLGQKLELSSKQSSEKNLTELLLTLDQCAQETKKTCVMVLDEFQQIGELKENHSIEAAIRHAVERSQYVTYIFCGSARHLLNKMFSDKSRPLYHLCDLITLDRIETPSYQTFLNHLAKKNWGKKLPEDCFLEIMHLTENHPYYVNTLCRKLWHNDTLPDLSTIRKTWHDYVTQQASWIVSDFSKLTLNRRKLLIALAKQPSCEPQSHAFSMEVNSSPSVIQKSLADLIQLDLVYKRTDGYYVLLNPAMSYFLSMELAA